MRSTRFMFVAMSFGAIAASAACSGNNGVEAEKATGGASSTNFTATGGAGVVVNVGGNGAGGDGPVGIQLPAAQDTVDGLYPVSADVAASVQGDTSVCTGGESKPQGGSAIIQFVIDASGSMFSNGSSDPSNRNSPSKWQVFSQTLPTIFASMPDNYAVGALYYGAQNSRCYAPSAYDVSLAMMAPTQLNALTTSVGRVQSLGSTPTYQAWYQGMVYVTNWAPGPNDPASMANAGRFVVLITDGVPTVGRPPTDGSNSCPQTTTGIALDEYNAELALVKDLSDQTAVNTFVVGVVGSNDPQGAAFDPLYKLSEWAVAGHTQQPADCVPVSGTPQQNDVSPRGTYCHYDLSTSTDLGASLSSTIQEIVASVLTCTYSVPRPPNVDQSIDPSQTVMVYTDGATGESSLVLQNTSDNCDKGWHFTDYTNSQIEICGSTCDAIQGNPNSSMNVVFGCNTNTIIN